MKKLFGFIFVLLAVGGGAYYYFVYDQEVEQPQVIMQPVSQGDVIEAVVATGSLEPVQTYNIGSQVSGIVQALYVDYNHIVWPGQVIAKIDPSLLETQVRIQEANIARQEGDIDNQKVQLADAQLNLRRVESLHEKGLVNDRELEQAKLTVLNREAQIESASRQLVSSRENLEQANLNVSYTTIKAPTEGIAPGASFVVVQRHVDVGQAVQSSMTSPQFFTLATDLRNLKLTAGVDEAEIGKVRSGMPVEFTVDTYGTSVFRGTVNAVRLNATSNQNVVTYPVWIDVPNPDLKLKPSMTAEVRIIVRTADDVLRVPTQATRFRPQTETYVALGLEPPAPGQGNAGRGRAMANNGGDPQTPAGGREGAAGAAAGREGQAGTGREGRGFGAGTTLDPNAMREVAGRFGREGGGRGTRTGGRQGGRGANATAANAGPPVELVGTKIDENFAALEPTTQAASVWTWNEETRELREIRVRTGITDGTFYEVVSGDLTPGMQLVTGVIAPASMTTTSPTQQNSIFNQGGGRGDRGGFGGGRGGGGRGRD